MIGKSMRQPKPESKEARLRAMREDGGKRKKISAGTIAQKMVAEMKPAAIAATTKAEESPEASTQETKLAKKSKSKKAAKQKTSRKAKSNGDGVKPGTKLAKVAAMLKRDGGCTAEQVKKACEWPSVSMPQQAKAAGLTLKKEKIDGVTHYSAA